MRCVIARYPFDLTKMGVLETMKGIKPELVTGESVTIGRRRYITRQDPRDFNSGEVIRAMTRLGFTCHGLPEAVPVHVLTPLENASALLGSGAAQDVSETV